MCGWLGSAGDNGKMSEHDIRVTLSPVSSVTVPTTTDNKLCKEAEILCGDDAIG